MIQSFTANISDHLIQDLKYRISKTRWPDEIKNSGWTYGASVSYLKELSKYWMEEFSWRIVEKQINAYPNFIAEIDGYKIHFIHIKGTGKNSIPLIITHGWPGSFLEMMKLIPLLTQNQKQTFDVIIPSILGFGFSQKVNIPGCNLWLLGDLWYKLMKELGYEKFLAQGGDFGAGISSTLALKHPDSLLGLHLNYIPGSYLPHLSKNEKWTEEELQFLNMANEWFLKAGSYAHQHRTKPATLAYGLNDSPIGLCAWIVEKFYEWSDCDGNIENVFSKDELLANVSLYWFTQTIHSSIRLYNENYKAPLHFTGEGRVSIPVGIARFAKEEPFPPRKFIERGYNIQHWTDIDRGGHFAAMEQPELLAGDIIKFAKCL